jgi:hypothetical protein
MGRTAGEGEAAKRGPKGKGETVSPTRNERDP